MEFSRKLKALATSHRYSQEMLAQNLGVSQNLVSLWTRGKSVPDLYEAGTIARLFGVSLDYLADDSLDEPPRGFTENEVLLVQVARDLGVQEVLRRVSRAVDPEPAPRHEPAGPVVAAADQRVEPPAPAPRRPSRIDQTSMQERKWIKEGTIRPEDVPDPPPGGSGKPKAKNGRK